jgi:predicted nucleic acid-binding protein
LRFWDSSALVASIVEEPTSETLGRFLREDDSVAVWWGTWVECAVAISQLLREGKLTGEDEEEARASLDLLAEDWREVQPTDEVRLLAALLSQRHPLRAADALQLAAAFVWRESATEDEGFVCLDDRLRLAAQEEGFTILPEQSASEIEARESRETE